mgnify:FL=1
MSAANNIELYTQTLKEWYNERNTQYPYEMQNNAHLYIAKRQYIYEIVRNLRAYRDNNNFSKYNARLYAQRKRCEADIRAALQAKAQRAKELEAQKAREARAKDKAEQKEKKKRIDNRIRQARFRERKKLAQTQSALELK